MFEKKNIFLFLAVRLESDVDERAGVDAARFGFVGDQRQTDSQRQTTETTAQFDSIVPQTIRIADRRRFVEFVNEETIQNELKKNLWSVLCVVETKFVEIKNPLGICFVVVFRSCRTFNWRSRPIQVLSTVVIVKPMAAVQ